MSEAQTLLLGFVAGVTILIGLPLGKLRAPRPGLHQFLNALAIGILLFLIWDVLVRFGPGAMAPGELTAAQAGVAGWSAARRLSLLIAVGIGLHNFGEGLAIGASAATGAIGLATILVIGFALHNATEGFGIVAPLAADGDPPSWRFLLLMGLIGGGPTFVGTAVGRQFTSPAVSVVFLTLAAGSIIYVVIQLVGVAHKSQRKDLLYWGVLLGLAAGFITDMVVTAGGA